MRACKNNACMHASEISKTYRGKADIIIRKDVALSLQVQILKTANMGNSNLGVLHACTGKSVILGYVHVMKKVIHHAVMDTSSFHQAAV